MLFAALLMAALASLNIGLRVGSAGSPAPSGGLRGSGGDLTGQALAETDGFARALGLGSTIVGAVALALVAFAVASEFSLGTIRNLLVRQRTECGSPQGSSLRSRRTLSWPL
jgi:hypothetical protein